MATDTSLAGKALSMNAAEIARAIGGRVVSGDAAVRVSGCSTDSRTVAKGNLFVALTGEKFDGHLFGKMAADRGAAVILASASRAAELAPLGVPVVAAGEDTLLALGKLGRAHRNRITAPVVGITGSAGKSTAKEMIAAVLAWGGRNVLKTEGNLNNRIGVPLTLMGATKDHSALVVEMGISFPGEMKELVAVAAPTVRILLNAGLAHVEFLRDADGVAAEKAAIFDGTREGDLIVWNADDPRVAREAGKRTATRRLSFGRHADADVRASRVETDGFGRLSIDLDVLGKPLAVSLKILGEHHVTNALAAATAGAALGVPLDEIKAGLETRFTPVPGRGDVKRLAGDVVLFDDTYNANPTSANAALSALSAAKTAGRTRAFAALGDMLELGPAGPEAHAALGREAARLKIDGLWLFGELSKRTAEGAASQGLARVAHFADRTALAASLGLELRAGDTVLAKGSRGMKMDEVVAMLIASRGMAA